MDWWHIHAVQRKHKATRWYQLTKSDLVGRRRKHVIWKWLHFTNQVFSLTPCWIVSQITRVLPYNSGSYCWLPLPQTKSRGYWRKCEKCSLKKVHRKIMLKYCFKTCLQTRGPQLSSFFAGVLSRMIQSPCVEKKGEVLNCHTWIYDTFLVEISKLDWKKKELELIREVLVSKAYVLKSADTQNSSTDFLFHLFPPLQAFSEESFQSSKFRFQRQQWQKKQKKST